MAAHPPVRNGAGAARVCRGAHAGDGEGAAGLRRTGGKERGVILYVYKMLAHRLYSLPNGVLYGLAAG